MKRFTVLDSFPDDVKSSRVASVEFSTDIELQDIVVDPSDSKQQTTEETLKRTGRQRCTDCCRQFIAFLFSTVGSCCLMVGYVVLGGLVFGGLEDWSQQWTSCTTISYFRRSALVV